MPIDLPYKTGTNIHTDYQHVVCVTNANRHAPECPRCTLLMTWLVRSEVRLVLQPTTSKKDAIEVVHFMVEPE